MSGLMNDPSPKSESTPARTDTRNNELVHTHLSLSKPSQANVDRYDRLRAQQWRDQEVNHA